VSDLTRIFRRRKKKYRTRTTGLRSAEWVGSVQGFRSRLGAMLLAGERYDWRKMRLEKAAEGSG
jgi:hypothetical protein